MKSYFDTVSQDCSNWLPTYQYFVFDGNENASTIIRQDIYNIYGFVRFADEIVDSFMIMIKKLI